MEDPFARAGWAKCAFVYGMLGWGPVTGVALWAAQPLYVPEPEKRASLSLHLAIFMGGGIVWGLALKWWSERKRRRAQERPA